MKIYRYLRLHIKIIPRRFSIVTPFTFLRYTHRRYMKCLFTNMQKQQNMLRSCLLFRKAQNSQLTFTFSGYCFYMSPSSEIFKSALVYLQADITPFYSFLSLRLTTCFQKTLGQTICFGISFSRIIQRFLQNPVKHLRWRVL